MSHAGVPEIVPVTVSLVVEADRKLAFDVFTAELDSWWPRSHHIGSSPMLRSVMEPGVGGRCYSVHEDGSSVQWGKVLAWEPPRRFVMAWQVTPQWKFEPDETRCSEVEVTFTPQDDGRTLVALEHRHFERHGEGAAGMRAQVGGDGGWNGLLRLFKASAESPRGSEDDAA